MAIFTTPFSLDYPFNGMAPPSHIAMRRQEYDQDNDGMVDWARNVINSPTTATFQAGSQTIGSGVSTISVTFPTAYSSAPTIVATISAPAAEDIITLNVDSDSVTTTGFTASLSSTTGSANYIINWMAN